MRGPLTAAVCTALVCAPANTTGQGEPVSGEYYWYAEKTGKLRSSEVRDGIVHISIFEHHGPVNGWLTVAARDDPEAKELGYLGVARNQLAFLRSTIASERAHGVKSLRELTGLALEEPHEWLRWYDENGDFLFWDRARAIVGVDVERRRSGLARAREGLRVHASVERKTFVSGEPLWITLRLENVSSKPIVVRGHFRLGEEWSVELRHHRPDDVGYVHYREAGSEDAETRSLPPGQWMEHRYDHCGRLDEPLAPGPYSLRASYRVNETATVSSATLFVDVVDTDGRRGRIFPHGVSYSGGDVDWTAVELVLGAGAPDFERCYDESFEYAPLPLRLELSWTLQSDGSITEAEVAGETLRNPALPSCLLEVLRGLPLPAPREGTPRLDYGLTFVP